MSRLMWFLIVSTFFFSSSFGSDVEVTINFEEDTAHFSYIFNFDENYNSFSFEKPRDANLISALDENNKFIRTSLAGDYFIVYPEETKNSTFRVDFESTSSYANIIENNVFSSYFSFNFDVENVLIELDFREISKEILTVNPRDYSIIEQGMIGFDFTNLENEAFIQIEFSPDQETTNSSLEQYFYVILSLLLLIILFAVFFLRNYLKNFRKENKSSSSEILLESSSEEVDSNSIDVTIGTRDNDKIKQSNEEKISKELQENKEDQKNQFEEYMGKYLTDNEREVVSIVKEFNGIIQNEILHHLPSLTKSNLSKIITKLHGKQVLSRIRVGKINKIYLGDKLNFEEVSEDNK